MTFTPEEKRTLCQIARGAVRAVLERQQFQLPDGLPESLTRPAGVFVSLRLNDDLRGCIGSVVPVEPLYIGVAHNALNAAFRDPRFPPLSSMELNEVIFEISVMSLPEPVADFDSIEVGRHGLIVRKGRLAGLLLPQVAIEYGWDREKFLAYACLKAGLDEHSWKDPDCRVEKFTAEVFTEVAECA